jgi:hypothetical protein
VAHDFAPDDDESNAISDQEVARIVLALDREITLGRRAAALHQIIDGQTVPLSVKPSRIELAVLTTLAQTYGGALLRRDFQSVRDALAECGAVVVVQRVLFGDAWGEQAEDVRLAARLLAARVPFEILCGTWPEVFMGEAHAELQGFRPRPPHPSKPPMESDDGEGDNG